MLYVQYNKDWFICKELGKHLIGIKKGIKVCHGEMIAYLEWQFGRHFVFKKNSSTFIFKYNNFVIFESALRIENKSWCRNSRQRQWQSDD